MLVITHLDQNLVKNVEPKVIPNAKVLKKLLKI